MSSDAEDLVDGDVSQRVREYLSRVLELATPDSLVAGGPQEFDDFFDASERDLETLREREHIYRTGGPVTDMIDSRALMTYGTGASFATESLTTDDRGRTVDEWLRDAFGGRDRLDLFHVEAGIQSYWAGDAWPQIVETNGGDFSHVTLVDPTTVDVAWDEHGELQAYRQVIKHGGRVRTEPLDTDRMAHFWHKRTTGGPLGESLIEQNRDEIEMFAANLRQRRNAIRQHGSPKFDVSVGQPDGQAIPDNLLRRVRQRIFGGDGVDENTNLVHGGGISIQTLEAPGFEGMGSIVENDARILSWGFGIPLEYTNMGSAGLGEGTPAESRQVKFERQARVEQSMRAAQFVEQLVRPILERYSPFPRDIDIRLTFGDVVSDQGSRAEWIYNGPHRDMTLAERREAMDLPEFTGDEDELGFQGPDEGQNSFGDVGGGGGLFRDPPPTERGLTLQNIPDNATNISDPSECSGTVVKGPRGGLWCVPAEGGGGDGGSEITEDMVAALPETFSDETRDEFDTAVASMANENVAYNDIVETVEENVDGLGAEGRARLRQQAYINQSGQIDVGGEQVNASPIVKTAFSREESELKQAASDQLDESFISESVTGIERHESQQAFDAWREEQDFSLLNDNTAELWGAAIDTTGNENVPDDAAATPNTVGEPLPAAVGETPATAIGDQLQITQNVLRDMFGDTVPVARGVSGEFAEELRAARENGESVTIEHRALESWSTFPDHSRMFATENDNDGVLLVSEVPVEAVFGASHTTPGLDESENELVVALEESREYSPEQIFDPDGDGMAGAYDMVGGRSS